MKWRKDPSYYEGRGKEQVEREELGMEWTSSCPTNFLGANAVAEWRNFKFCPPPCRKHYMDPRPGDVCCKVVFVAVLIAFLSFV